MVKYLKLIKEMLFLDADTKAFARHNRRTWGKPRRGKSAPQILVEHYPVAQTMISFSYVANILARQHGADILSFSTSVRSPFLFKLRFWAVAHVYKSFNASISINSRAASRSNHAKVAREYDRVLGNLRTKGDVFDIEVEGCAIGCDIYEAYLSERMKPTVDLQDPGFRSFLRETLHFFFHWKDYFATHDVKAVILSHGLYKYGILKRICIKEKIPVYLPTVRSLFCIRKAEELGNPEFDAFPALFRKLPKETQEKGLEWAKGQLTRRISGEVGVDMHYSTKSAYAKAPAAERALAASPRLKVLIATHCFFDNPNAYGINLFPDFYEWLDFLGKMSEATDYDWYLKTHPDVLPGNDEILAGILSRYPKIRKLSPTVSHHQLWDEGISVVLTTYGSVGHEYPMVGKQVVNAGMNPHIGYDFNYHPKTVEEYRSLILDLGSLDKKLNPDEVIEFYFMNYKYSVCERFFFPSFSEFCARLPIEDQNSPRAYRYFMEKLDAGRHQAIIGKIEGFIASGEYKYYESDPFSVHPETDAKKDGQDGRKAESILSQPA